MVFAPHVRVTALGRLAESGERFAYGLNLAPINGAGVPGLSANQNIWDDLAADVRAFHVRPATRIASVAVLEVVKFASIGADGRYVEDPVIVDVADAAGGAGWDQRIPPQSALAISLTTDRRGPSGKGRFYIPMPIADLTAGDLLLDDAMRDPLQASAAQLLTDVGNAPGIDVLDLYPVVASTKGFNTKVTGVRVGRVVDTISSRRRSLLENFDPPTAVAFG